MDMAAFGRGTGSAYTLIGATGTMAAALAQDALIFAMRAAPNPAAGPVRNAVEIDGLNLAFTTIVAFTAPILAGRLIGIYKGTVASPTGGTAISPIQKRTTDAGADNGLEASPRIATTAGLTAGAFVRGAQIGTLDLAGVGAAGGFREKYFPFFDAPIILEPGELMVLSNPAVMDAAGTWQLVVEVDYSRRD